MVVMEYRVQYGLVRYCTVKQRVFFNKRTPFYFFLSYNFFSIYAIFACMKEQDIKKYFDKMAPNRDKWKKKSGYYYSYLENFISFIVPENKRVLEIGCGTGDLLFKLKPSYGLGVDISDKMIELAKGKNSNPKIEFKVGTTDNIEGLFDYIILSDLIGYLPDIEEFFRKLPQIMHPQSKIIITQYSHLWEPVLSLASSANLRMPASLVQNWISLEDINNFCG